MSLSVAFCLSVSLWHGLVMKWKLFEMVVVMVMVVMSVMVI